MKLLIVTPMQAEMNYFAGRCAARGFQPIPGATSRQPTLTIPGLNAIVARGGTGKAQYAAQTQHLIDSIDSPDLVICAGAAGALGKQLSIGDVVVATATIEHDFNEKFDVEPLPKFDSSPEVLEALGAVALPDRGFNLYFGPVASGDEDVVDNARKEALRRATGALAVAWEGAGGARACHFSKVPFIEIRAVTDQADEDAPTDFRANLGIAMSNIADLMLAWTATGQ